MQVSWHAREGYQRINRCIAAMFDNAGSIVTAMQRYRYGFNPRARAHYDVNPLATAESHHGVNRCAQSKPCQC